VTPETSGGPGTNPEPPPTSTCNSLAEADDTAPVRQWPSAVHEQLEAEVAAAYHAGLEAGVKLARETYQRVIDEALRRPDGHGGPDLDESARSIIEDLYRRYLGVGR